MVPLLSLQFAHYFRVSFDFKNYRVCPTHYSIRYGTWNSELAPRNWVLQATNFPAAFEVSSETDAAAKRKSMD